MSAIYVPVRIYQIVLWSLHLTALSTVSLLWPRSWSYTRRVPLGVVFYELSVRRSDLFRPTNRCGL